MRRRRRQEGLLGRRRRDGLTPQLEQRRRPVAPPHVSVQVVQPAHGAAAEPARELGAARLVDGAHVPVAVVLAHEARAAPLAGELCNMSRA